MCVCFLFFFFGWGGKQCCTEKLDQFSLNDTRSITKCILEINVQSKSERHTQPHISI
jgi:hypothetical protein